MSEKTNFLLSKMVIGTAQFGLDYGFNAATAKKVAQDECTEMLNISQANNISILDTAEAYGDAIEKIAAYHAIHGQKFEVISKFLTPDNILKPLRDSLQKLSYYSGTQVSGSLFKQGCAK
jgi:aryl-alcohol dehydrogenase-like predicted oxidoreductase